MLNYLWWYVIFAFICYVLGSFNFAVFFSGLFKTDIRKIGSKNPGALNTFRCCGFTAGALTFLFDALKGFICAVIGLFTLKEGGAFLGMLFCNTGHIFPLFHKFKGGKGIAVTFGAMFAVDFVLALCVLAALSIYLLLFENGALGTVVCTTILTTVQAVCFYSQTLAVIALPLNLTLIFIRHIPNIKRSRKGSEPLFALKKRKRKDGSKLS